MRKDQLLDKGITETPQNCGQYPGRCLAKMIEI